MPYDERKRLHKRRNSGLPKAPNGRKLYSVAETASRLGLSPPTIHKWIADKGAPAYLGRRGRVLDLEELRLWLRDDELAPGLAGLEARGREIPEPAPLDPARLPLPDLDEAVDMAAIEKALAGRSLTEAERVYVKHFHDAAKAKKVAAMAEERRIMNERKRLETVRTEYVVESLQLIFAPLRRAAKVLQVRFGEDARQVYAEALEAGEREVKARFG